MKSTLEETLAATRDAPMDVQTASMQGLPPLYPGSPQVEVTQEKSQDAALRFRGRGVTVLNFASAKNPGGGVRRGAKAQEEDLCRCSGLLHTLERANDFYAQNRERSTPREYLNRMLISTGVPIVRDGSLGWVEPMSVTVISCPAPNMDRGVSAKKASEVIRFRARHIVHQAAARGTEVLVLGAWGCGVFRNEPEVVAEAWKIALDQHGGSISQVVHPVFGNWLNYEVFRRVLQDR